VPSDVAEKTKRRFGPRCRGSRQRNGIASCSRSSGGRGLTLSEIFGDWCGSLEATWVCTTLCQVVDLRRLPWAVRPVSRDTSIRPPHSYSYFPRLTLPSAECLLPTLCETGQRSYVDVLTAWSTSPVHRLFVVDRRRTGSAEWLLPRAQKPSEKGPERPQEPRFSAPRAAKWGLLDPFCRLMRLRIEPIGAFRTVSLGTRVNKGEKRKGRGCYTQAFLLSVACPPSRYARP
jgi:hypothetical protein